MKAERDEKVEELGEDKTAILEFTDEGSSRSDCYPRRSVAELLSRHFR